MQVCLEGEIRKTDNMVIDYHDLMEIVQPAIDLFDHRHINEVFVELGYSKQSPTAEYISCFLFGLITNLLIEDDHLENGEELAENMVIGLWEHPTSYVEVDVNDWILAGRPGSDIDLIGTEDEEEKPRGLFNTRY
jgi:6-pyruvoyl-tetrahydropterin synthase